MIAFRNGFVAFRPADASDSAAIAGLHSASWRRAYRGILPDSYLDGEIAQERLELWENRLLSSGMNRRLVLLAESASDLAGFVCILLDAEPEWGACLDNLHVRPDSHRRGLGRLLFAEATRWLMSKEPGWPLHLWVFEANPAARGFYDRFGGEVVTRKIKRMPGGAEIASLRYLWRDTQTLLNRLAGRPAV
ncbi:MAG: GNAT family N-acetyltransferase [Desulfobacterales bacterium]|jgi:GNAT superfamily N-acetyltransferase|nr:GNAT family N-acetyltransferase [Desulfobacterales bacterium]